MSKFLSIDALSSVSSWCVPFSISRLAASSAGSGASVLLLPPPSSRARFFELKHRLLAGRETRRLSTESTARPARTLTALMMSSRSDCVVADILC